MTAPASSAASSATRVEEIEVDGVLFDMDGTLIDSTPAVNATWEETARRFNLDLDYVMANCHGWRTIENLRRFIPSLTDDELPREVVKFESRIGDIAAEAVATGKPGAIVSLPGAKELLAQINAGREQDPQRRQGWAIVTSATKAYAHKAFPSSGVAPAFPETFITGDLCTAGKPDPQPYLLGARGSRAASASASASEGASTSTIANGTAALSPSSSDDDSQSDARGFLVVEDAPPGVLSGKRAGASYVLGLKTTHAGEKQWANGADFVCDDLRSVSARWEGSGADARLFIRIETEARPEGVEVVQV
ncbi:DL-glycerol-3-phosphatase [Tilletia horrida]|nr:DL-glycerol-3-phosphatase [Tilletia horrida]